MTTKEDGHCDERDSGVASEEDDVMVLLLQLDGTSSKSFDIGEINRFSGLVSQLLFINRKKKGCLKEFSESKGKTPFFVQIYDTR